MAKRGADAITEADSVQQPVDKKAKPADPEGSWTCPFCSNVNWPLRTHCNKRDCNMPRDTEGRQHPEGSWACGSCKNVNWPKRTVCNRCQLPRNPGQTVGTSFNPNDHRPGSWPCPTCGNVNWPKRTVCNRQGCTTPRPMAYPAGYVATPYAQAYQQGGLSGVPSGEADASTAYYAPQAYMGKAANPYMAAGVNVHALAAAAQMMHSGAMGNHPPGSWVCPQCQNINWPKRTVCNKQGCGAARPAETYGGYNPGQQQHQQQQQQQHPEGSWVCPGCNNVNWPQRTVCNKKGCQLPRPAEPTAAV